MKLLKKSQSVGVSGAPAGSRSPSLDIHALNRGFDVDNDAQLYAPSPTIPEPLPAQTEAVVISIAIWTDRKSAERRTS